MKHAPIEINIAEGPNRGGRVVTSDGRVLVGTSFDCDVVLSDTAIDQYHLEICRLDDADATLHVQGDVRKWIKGSPDNNGQRVEIPCVFGIGDTVLEIGPLSAAPTPALEAENENANLAEEAGQQIKKKAQELSKFVDNAADIPSGQDRAPLVTFAVGMLGAALILAVFAILMSPALWDYGRQHILPADTPQTVPVPTVSDAVAPLPAGAAGGGSAENASQYLEELIAAAGFDLVNSGIINGTIEAWGVLPDAELANWNDLLDSYDLNYGFEFPLTTQVELASKSPLLKRIGLVSLGTNRFIRTPAGEIIRPGEILADGWRIETVSREGIALQRGDRHLLLKLR